MKIMINSKTKMFGSFSIKAGDTGCKIFNTCFQYDNVNAIYKSFSISDIKLAVSAAKCLNFTGFAVSMPYKSSIIEYLDTYDEYVYLTGTCNTVLIDNDNKLHGHNTDYLAISRYLQQYHKDMKKLFIIGDGCYSHNVQKYCTEHEIQFIVISRSNGNWHDINNIKDSYVFNCTPIEVSLHESNVFIDCINTTVTGKELAYMQAAIQYKLYTGLPFPLVIPSHDYSS